MVGRRSRDTSNSDLLTTGQAAEALGVRSVNTVKRWVREGSLDGMRLGSRILIRKESVDRFRSAGRINDDVPSGNRTGQLTRKRGRQDVLAELRGLPRDADQAEREKVEARTLDEIRRRVKPFLTGRGISRAFLFGSAARGAIHRRSDIDIAVELPEDSAMDIVDFAGLALDLEDALGRRVDLVNIATMKPRIRSVARGEEVGLL